MKDRLIELLSLYFGLGDSYAYNLTRAKSAFAIGTMRLEDFEEFDADTVADLADYLLADGVIVPPCKIGDTAYCIVYAKDGYKNVIEHRIVGFHIIDAPPKRGFKRENYLIFFHEQTNLTSHCPFKKIGKNVFFTREEAEQALKERREQS